MEPHPHSNDPPDRSSVSTSDLQQEIRIPLVQEDLQVSKRILDTGRGIRIHKSVQERTEQVELVLHYDELTVEHVPMDQLLADSAMPVPRYDGATLIVPVVEEVLRIEKQWRLKEEVRITRHQRERQTSQSVVLMSETVNIERFEEAPADSGSSSSIVN